jgi:hypothetical protein
MKKTLHVFAIACISLLALPAAAQVPAYVPTDGLVGWWPFNGNANDESGNGNDGVVNGATLTEDRMANPNSCYSFNNSGGGNSIVVAHSPSFEFEGDMSFSLWIKTSSNINTATWLMKYAGNISGFSASLSTNTQASSTLARWDLGNGQTNQFGFQYVGVIGSIVTDDVWHNVIGTFTDNVQKIYVDGILTGASANNQNGIGLNTVPLTIGRDPAIGNNRNYNGLLDDIAIYNRALTEQEIQNLYTGTTPPPCVSLPSNLQQGLVGYWPFCGNANDESGNGNDGTVNGATLTEDRFGNAGKAYVFDGVDDFIEVSHNNALNSLPVTLTGWFNLDLTSNGQWIAGKYACASGNGYSAHLISGKPSAFYYSGNDNNSRIDLDVASTEFPSYLDSTWHQMTLVYDTIGLYYYIDGTLITSTNFIGLEDSIGAPTNTLSPLLFGKYAEGSCINFPQEYFHTKGKIDDIGIWNRALTQEEVQELYTLDACTFTVYDTSYVTVYDTLTTYETVYDTLYTYETIYDTLTTYVTVTDTLLIDITFTGFEGQPSWLNTVTVFPNPASDHITIDYGNFALMAGYNTIITDAAGATVYSSAVNSQQAYIDINAWGAAGVYYMTIYDASGAAVAVRHIVLE